MDVDIAYYVTYHCPRCKLELEAENGGWRGWLRCPGCGTPSLPPEILLGHPTTRRRVVQRGGEDAEVLVIGDDEAQIDPAADRPPLIEAPPSPLLSVLSMVFLTGLVMSLFILLIAYLDENQTLTAVFGFLSFVFFILLLRVPSRARRRR